MLGMAINIQSVRFLDDDTTALHRARTFLSLAAQLWLFLVLQIPSKLFKHIVAVSTQQVWQIIRQWGAEQVFMEYLFTW